MKRGPFVLGLTGSIGMGKTTAARILSRVGFPVYNADKAVHDMLKIKGEAVAPIARVFPQSFKRGAINRLLLGKIVFGHPALLKKLERILHPLVQKKEQDFILKAKQEGAIAVVLEIPLMFETGADRRCDRVICVTAPFAVQKERVLSRKHMTVAKFKAICQHQMSDAEKRKRADFVVSTHRGLADTRQQLLNVLTKCQITPDTHA